MLRSPFSISCLVAATVARGCKSRDALRALECRTSLLAEVIVFDQIGRIKVLDPWTDLTSICHPGYIYTDPQMTVKAYPHTAVWVPIGCSHGLWGRYSSGVNLEEKSGVGAPKSVRCCPQPRSGNSCDGTGAKP